MIGDEYMLPVRSDVSIPLFLVSGVSDIWNTEPFIIRHSGQSSLKRGRGREGGRGGGREGRRIMYIQPSNFTNSQTVLKLLQKSGPSSLRTVAGFSGAPDGTSQCPP